MASESLIGNSQQTKDIDGHFGISVWSVPDLAADEIANVCRIPHGRIRVATVGDIRAAGFTIISTPEHGYGHHNIVLGSLPDEATCDRLRSVFHDERDNPRKTTGA